LNPELVNYSYSIQNESRCAAVTTRVFSFLEQNIFKINNKVIASTYTTHFSEPQASPER
jgi:hypothetical protein